jgi:hypothetical protein
MPKVWRSQGTGQGSSRPESSRRGRRRTREWTSKKKSESIRDVFILIYYYVKCAWSVKYTIQYKKTNYCFVSLWQWFSFTTILTLFCIYTVYVSAW